MESAHVEILRYLPVAFLTVAAAAVSVGPSPGVVWLVPSVTEILVRVRTMLVWEH